MPINLNGKASEARKQLVAAFQGEDAEALEAAFATFQAEVATDLMEQFEDAMEAHDETILAQRGFPQLTQRETKYFEAVIKALKSDNPKQELTRLATIGDGTGETDVKTRMMPETIIDEILKDIEETHPLLGILKVTNVGYVTTWLRNKHTRQLAVWGMVESAITKEITSSFDVVNVVQGKLSCFAAVSQDMLNLGPRWMAAYVRVCLGEAMACGLENGAINGKGIKGEPIGLIRDILEDVNQTTGYAKKDAVAVTSFDPASYGALVATMALTDEGKVKQSLANLTLVCSLTDYLTKVMPATTLLNTSGQYVNDLFPIPTKVCTSEFVESGEAVLFLPAEYDLLVGGNRGIEYSDEYQFLEDNRVFKVVQNAFGLPRWNTSALVLDISELDPAYVTVKVNGTVTTQESVQAGS
jgi:HK97 family phage major capsid protein